MCMKNEEQNNNSKLVLVGAKVDRSVKETIKSLAKEDDRSLSYIINQLLETHPRIQERLKTA